MRDLTFDPLELLADLRTRWHVVAASCSLAVLLSLAISLSLPKKYTATAEVLIQAPGGNDPRAATAVSPVYLESLKAYERLAGSDTLFLRALDHLQIARAGSGRSVESLRKSVLKVSKPANTAILEISATMTEPKKAQALAQYIAEQTAGINQSIDNQSEADMTREFHNQFDAARTALTKARAAEAALNGSEPVTSLEGQIENNADLKLRVEKDLSATRTELAGYKAEEQLLGDGERTSSELVHRMIASSEAKLAELERQRRDLLTLLTEQGGQVETWKSRRTMLDADVKAAQAAFETANARLNEVTTSAQFRGERLRVVDPGIVPQEPSSPNVLLNLLAALLAAAVGSTSYLVLSFSFRRASRSRADAASEREFSFGR